MGRKNPILTTSLCVSLIAHGLGLTGMAWWLIERYKNPRTPPIDKISLIVDHLTELEKQNPHPKPQTPKPQDQKPPAQKPPTPPPAEKRKPPPKPIIEKPQEKLKDDSGEANGTGDANRSTDGKQPMQATMGAQQADLMLKKAKAFAESLLPASAGEKNGDTSAQQKSPKLGSDDPPNHTSVAIDSTPVSTEKGPLPELKTSHEKGPTESGVKNPIANVPLSDSPTFKLVQREILGHEATASDTESLAMSNTNGGVFRAGKMKGRNGLTVKQIEPRYHDSSIEYFEIHGDVATLFGVKVDADGKVLDIQILQSSGSDNIDLDRKLALNEWTLMPAKDKDGHIIDDVWIVAFE